MYNKDATEIGRSELQTDHINHPTAPVHPHNGTTEASDSVTLEAKNGEIQKWGMLTAQMRGSQWRRVKLKVPNVWH